MADNTKFSGKGYYEYPSGGEYEGEFVDGKIEYELKYECIDYKIN